MGAAVKQEVICNERLSASFEEKHIGVFRGYGRLDCSVRPGITGITDGRWGNRNELSPEIDIVSGCSDGRNDDHVRRQRDKPSIPAARLQEIGAR